MVPVSYHLRRNFRSLADWSPFKVPLPLDLSSRGTIVNKASAETESFTELTVPTVKQWSELEDSQHLVQFYEDEEYLLRSLSEYVDNGLSSGDACIIVASEPHRVALEQILKLKGHDLLSASGAGLYIPLDAAETLSKFTVQGIPDGDLFQRVIGPIIDLAAEGNRRVRIYGEMVALLWSEKKFDAAIRLEEFWNKIATTRPFALCCGYPIQEFEQDILQHLGAVCSSHSVVVPGESYASAITPQDRLAVITALQQKAKALEREVAERKQTERQLRASEAKYRQLKDQLEQQLEQREEILQREQTARLEAQSANRMKDEFLATVSHELRTPLTSLFGWTRLLRSANLDPSGVSRALDAIERSVQAQRQLVEDLLDVSRIIAGKLQLQMTSVQIESIIETALNMVRPLADAKSISIRLHFASRIPPVQGDPARLEQIIWNLLTNAIKFTPQHGRVDVSLTSTSSDVNIIVQDTGEGISSEFLPYVFDRFRQADSTTTRRHGGLGLGLAIVRHLVELHGGMVHAESSGKTRGAIFMVTLPGENLYDSPKPQEERSLPSNILTSFTGLKVLVVEDDRETQEMLRLLFKQWSAVIKVAASAPDALELLKEWEPDILLSDIGLPGEDGYSLIQKIRELPTAKGGHVPAIAFTADAKPEDRIRAISEGFNVFLSQPIEPTELAASIYSLTRFVQN